MIDAPGAHAFCAGYLRPRVYTASLAALSALVALAWRASSAASAHTTFNLPLLSSQPCVLMLALLPALAVLVAQARRRVVRAGRPATGLPPARDGA